MKCIFQRWELKVFFLSVLLYGFGNLLMPHYSSDSYYIYFDQNGRGLASGRILVFVFFTILNIFKINAIETQSVWSLLSILIIVAAAYKLYTAFETFLTSNNTYSRIVLGFICLMPFVNIYFLEWFLFPEVIFPYTVGLYCSIKAALCFNYKNLTLKNFIFSFGLLCVGVCAYQINITYYLPIALVIVALNQRFNLSIHAFLSSLGIGCVGGMAGLVTIFFQKALGQTLQEREAVFSIAKVLENCKEVIDSQKTIWMDGSDLGGHWMLLFLVVNLVIIIIVLKGTDIKSKLYIILIMAASYCSSYVFVIVSNFIWLSPRVLTGIPVFLMITSLLCIFNINILKTEEKWSVSCSKRIMFMAYGGLMCAFIVINIIYMQWIIHDHYANNAIDQEYARQIYYEIEKYEQESGKNIERIAVGKDKQLMWKNTGISKMAYNVNERALINDWSDVTVINFISGRSFEREEMLSSDYEAYFTSKNWNKFVPAEQIVFKDNIMYWVKY